MGVVYQARDPTLGRIVALKTFGAMSAIAKHERDGFEQRFLSEARISATLDDPHVVAVYDVGRDIDTGLLFMALEYIKGETLANALSRGAMPWSEAATIAAKVARALQSAHSHHIVHRDIKPANIMLNAAGEPKIMDFGIAKANAAQLTVAGQIFGTPAYMSPEQAAGEDVDGRSDIFSLGAVLYELVTNTRPFEGPTLATTLTRILNEVPKPASSRAKAPRNLDAILGKAMRKRREDRYDSAGHFAHDLERLVEGQPPMYATRPGPLETVSLQAAPSLRRTSPPQDAPGELYVVEEKEKKNPLRLAGGIFLAVMLGVTAVLLLTRAGRDEESAPSAAASAAGAAAGPSILPTRPLIPTPTPAPVLSMESSGSPARVSLDLRHSFASGALRVKVDDRIVLANNIHGMPMKVKGVPSGYDGRFGADLVIPPGDHVIQIEVRSGPTEFVESTRVQLRGGETRRLVALVGKSLTLSFE